MTLHTRKVTELQNPGKVTHSEGRKVGGHHPHPQHHLAGLQQLKDKNIPINSNSKLKTQCNTSNNEVDNNKREIDEKKEINTSTQCPQLKPQRNKKYKLTNRRHDNQKPTIIKLVQENKKTTHIN